MFRWTFAAVPLALLAAPAPVVAADRELADAAARLSDPATQDRMADAVSAMVSALMQINIGPIAQAVGQIDPESPAAYIPPDATLGEIAGEDDPEFAERMGDDIRASTRMMGAMAGSVAVMAPVFKDMARDLEAQWQQARRDARQR